MGAGLYFSGALDPEIPVEARVFNPTRVLKPFNLVNQDNQAIKNDILADKWTLIFLGYTHCPDVCPTTLAKLANSYPRLKQTADNTQVMFVSVDPKRDNSARLKEYSAYFNPEFIAASAEHAALFPFVRSLGLMYSMTEDTNQPQYDVSHSGSIVLIDPKGQLHAMFRPKEIIGDIPYIDMKIVEQDFASLTAKF
jgi:protein SCO1/2